MKVFGFKIVFLASIFFFLFSCSVKKEEEVIRIVFYKIPNDVASDMESVLKKQFLFNDDEKMVLEFEKISEENVLKEKVEKDENISLIFSNTIRLPFEKAKTISFDVSLYETFPSCIKRYSFGSLEKNAEGAINLPILLNTYHLFFNNMIFEKYAGMTSYNANDFSNMLKGMSLQAKYPLLCAGGEDETLLFFVASIMQMVGDVYSIRCEKISSLRDREDVLNSALKLIVEWQKNGYLHPEWFRLRHRDISMFMDLREIGVLFASMREYKKNENKQFYSLMPFPLSKNSSLNGLPISVFSIVEPIQKKENTSEIKNNYISKIIEYCISMEGQKDLSDATGFNSSSMSNTNQNSVSSVRYTLATASVVLENASTLEGSFDPTILAKEMREYFQANGVGY